MIEKKSSNPSLFRVIFPFLHSSSESLSDKANQESVNQSEKPDTETSNDSKVTKPMDSIQVSSNENINTEVPPVNPHINTEPRSILRKNTYSCESFMTSSSARSSESDDEKGLSNKRPGAVFTSPIVTTKIALDKITNPDPMTHKSSSSPLLWKQIYDKPKRRGSTGILGRTIRFDPQVWVHEYKRTDERKDDTWWSAEEMERFKIEAISRIRKMQTDFAGSGTGRIVYSKPKGKAFYNHPALGLIDDDEDGKEGSINYKKLSESELKTILIIDPHDIFLRLFAKSFKQMLPHVEVFTASSSEEATRQIESRRAAYPVSKGGAVHGFDLILAEERLQGPAYGRSHRIPHGQEASQSSQEDTSKTSKQICSGSDLFARLSLEEEEIKQEWLPSSDSNFRYSLFIGVSAHIKEDGWKLKKSGVTCIWGKPPPKMNDDLRAHLVNSIAGKRNIKMTEQE